MNFSSPEWPLPKFDAGNQPHFLFIITPPYSGSTALAQLLNTSHRTMILQERGEGQWLIPGLCASDRWEQGKAVNYDSVRAVWLNKFQEVQRLVQNVDVVIEKSPPNMMRIDRLSAQFERCSFLANNRNPYANCASTLYRKSDAENIGRDRRLSVLNDSLEKWIARSRRIRELVLRLGIPLITYEEFCRSPASAISRIDLPDGVADTMNPDAEIKVKDYRRQRIANQNDRQIANLTDGEIDSLSKALAREEELLSFFGYQPMGT
jgi:hypothetical protein